MHVLTTRVHFEKDSREITWISFFSDFITWQFILQSSGFFKQKKYNLQVFKVLGWSVCHYHHKLYFKKYKTLLIQNRFNQKIKILICSSMLVLEKAFFPSKYSADKISICTILIPDSFFVGRGIFFWIKCWKQNLNMTIWVYSKEKSNVIYLTCLESKYQVISRNRLLNHGLVL